MSGLVAASEEGGVAPTSEQEKAGLLANSVHWDDAVRARPEYQASSADGSGDAALAEALNALTVAGEDVVIDAPVGDVLGYLLSRMLLAKIEAFVAAPPDGMRDLVAGLHALLTLVTTPHIDVVKMTDPEVAASVKAILAGAAAAGLLSEKNVADLLAFGVRKAVATPWWRSIGASWPLNEYDIHRARAEG